MRRIQGGPALAALLLLLPASRLAGQAPVVGPEGDPSVQDDTIYALTVDPADHPEESSVLLLDDGIIVQEADGTGSRTYRSVAQVLNRDGIEAWAEHSFGYDGGRERFRLNWARVVGADGKVISSEPIHQQVMDVPVPEQSPVYTDLKRVRISMGGVEPGTIVDFSYTVETIEPVMPREFFASWRITTGGTVRRSRYVVDVPKGYDLRMVESPGTEPTSVEEVGGRVVRQWAAADLERVDPEAFADAAHADFLHHVELGGPNTWSDIGAWYAGLAKGRYDVGDDVMAAARAVLDSADTAEGKLRLLHRWIAQDFRYISISLGAGGYQPRPPAEVVRTLSGDCKDKATLFVALARELGFEAHPVLLSSSGGVEEALPSVRQFDHEIAAVRRPEGWLFLDLTADIVPFGSIPPTYQGELGLVVFDDGSVEEVTFPENTPADNLSETTITAEIHDDGSLTGWYDELNLGSTQYRLRGALSQEFSQKDLQRVADAVASGVIEGAVGDSLQVFDGRDFDAEPRLRVWVRAERAARRNGSSGYILPVPLSTLGSPTLLAQLERERETRRYPIDVGEVVGPITSVTRLELTLPEGWAADLPESVHADSRFGTYASEYTQEGRVVRLERRVSGREGTAPKEAIGELIDWLRIAAADDIGFIALRPGA